MQLTALSDNELLNWADNTSDPLTSTALEAELVRRLRNGLDLAQMQAGAIEILSNHGIDETKTADLERLERALNWESEFAPDTHRPLLDKLAEYDIDDATVLDRTLKRDAELPAVLEDLQQSLARVSELMAGPEDKAARATQIDQHLDAVLKAAGSSLRNYTTAKTLNAMRAAMDAAMGTNSTPA